MSKTIDEKVVEMRLENSNFERNAATSIGTLARLKQSLNLTGASKGLEQVNAAAGKVNMGGLGSAVDAVGVKFSALQVMGVTALANLSNSVTNAAKNFVSALTVAPVGDGFKEYEMTLNAVQTTMAATEMSAKDVEEELKKLDDYADQTIYSTADMLNNLPKFTNAGVELKDATTAMIGIANATALAGGDASKASIAFYNLGQAIGTGYLTRMDYNSINNAGIATMKWKEQMVEAAIAAGTLEKAGEDAYIAGGKTFTMQQLFIDGLQHQWASTDVMMKVFKDYGDKQTEIGEQAFGAAQNIKTFSMMLDSLKATAGTGWKETWQIIFGGLDEATEFWTGLNNVVSGMITSMADFRNGLLEGALGKTFTHLMEPIRDIKDTINGVAAPVKEVTESFDKYNKVVKEVIRGDWGVTEKRWKSLTEAGYDWATVQNMVNEELGSSVKHATDFKLKQDKLAESEKKLVENGEKLAENGKKQNATQKDLEKTNAKYIDTLSKKTDAELKDMNLTPKQIAGIRAIQKESDKLGLSVEDFVLNIDDLDGRQIIINSFKNAWEGLGKVFGAMSKAWKEVFPPKTMEERAAKMYDLIAAVHKFSTKLVMNEKTAGKLTRTFKGLFALVSIISDVVGGGLKIAFKAVSAVLGYFDLDILSVTAAIGDALVKLREMTDVSKLFRKVIEFLAPVVAKVADSFQRWITSASTNPKFIEYVSNIKEAFIALKNTDFKGIGKHIVDGFKLGVKDGFGAIIDSVMELGVKILEVIKAVLGIHSPSTEFFDIGKNIIQGLINGLQNGVSGVLGLIKGIGEKCIEFFRNIDWGAIFAAGIAAGTIYLVTKIGAFFGAITSVAEGLGDILENTGEVVKSFSGVLKSVSLNIKAKAMKDMAIAIAILAGAVIALSFVDPWALLKAVGTIGALAGIMYLLALAMDKLSKVSVSFKDGINLDGLKTSLLAIGGVLLLMGVTVKLMGSMEREELERGFTALVGAIVAMGLVFLAYGKLVKGKAAINIDKAGAMLVKMSIALLLMINVAKLAGRLDQDDLINGGIVMAAFAVFVGVMVAVTKKAGKNIDKVGGMMTKLSIAMLLTIGVVKLAGQLSLAEAVNGVIFAVAFGVFITALVAIVKTAGKDIPKIGGMLLAVSASMLLLIGAMKLVSMLEVGEIVKGGLAVIAFTLLVRYLMKLMKTLHKAELPKMAGTLLAMSVTIGIMAAVAIMLSLISIEGLAKGIVAVGLLSTFMKGMIKATRGAADCKGNLIVMTVAIAIMAASVAALSMIKPDKLAGATVAMSVVMGMFALMLSQAKNVSGSIGVLITLTAAIAIFGGVIYLLAKLPAQQVIGAAIALSVLVGALSLSLGVLALIGNLAGSALGGVLALRAMAVPLLEFVVILALMQGVKNATANVKTLTTLTGALTLMLIPLTLVGSFAPSALLGVLALRAMAGPLLAFVVILALMQGIENAEANANLLTGLLNTLTKVLVVLAIVGPLALIGAAALTVTTSLITGVGVMVMAIGALMSLIPKGVIEQWKEGLATFIDFIVILAGGLGEALGAFVSGALNGIASSLPSLGASLSAFMVNMRPFINGVKLIDTSVLVGVGILSASILALTAVDLISGIASLIPGGSSLADLGSQLSAFMSNATPFFKGIKMVDATSLQGVKALAEAILILTATDVINGMTYSLTGGNSLGEFGSQLGQLGTDLNSFATNLGSFDESKTETIKCAGNAIKALAEVAKGLPNEGGWAAAILGDNSIATFGSYLPGLGTNLAAFATNLGSFDESKANTITCAGNAIKAMAEAAKDLPNQGGWAAAILGDNSIATFSSYLPGLGTNLAAFAKNLGTFDEDKINTVSCATKAIKAMAEAADGIPNEGGWAAKIFGDNNLADFGDQIASVGKNLKTFASNLGTFGSDKITTVESAVKMVKALAKLSNANLKGAKNNLSGFGKNLIKFAESITKFCNGLPSAGSIASATKSVETLIDFVNSFKGKDSKGILDFSKNLSKIGKDSVKKFVDAFTSSSAKKNVKEAGVKLMKQLIDGVESKEKAFKKASQKVAEKGADGAEDKKSDFKSAGKDLGDGLVQGIKSKEDAVYKAGYNLGKKAVQGEKDGQKSKSPSKLTIQAGKWLGEGLIIGMAKTTNAVYRAGYDLGNSATDTISKSIARIGEIISTGIDDQPTIRPVLDLSEVTAGAGAINGMLDMSPSIGLAANLSSIGALANNRQNGNDDVVLAIDKLSRSLSNLPSGDSYNINGITYDDGSNIAGAVKDIVRAARIGRRV